MTQYSTHWCLTIIAAVIINFLAVAGVSTMWNDTTPAEDETEVIDWVDVDVDDVNEQPAAIADEAAPPEVVQEPEIVSEFPPLIIPPLPEIPKYVPEPLPVIETPPPTPAVIKPETKSNTDKSSATDTADNSNKTDDDTHKKIKVISKVYPKDIVNELLEAGLINEAHKLHNGTVLVQVLIGVDGKVKRTEIKRGGGYDERGNTINTLIEMAAAKWVFEPYLDEDNQPKEMPTQIEFKPEDF